MKKSKTIIVRIYLSGPISIIQQICRQYCLEIGLCVTVTPTVFIYTGGEEFGVEIGLLNYPRFPDSEAGLIKKAIDLANRCRNGAAQHSYLVVTPKQTIWNSTRK